MSEIKNNETQENEVQPRECEKKEDFDKALDKKEGMIRDEIGQKVQEERRAADRAEKLGPISEAEKAKNAEARNNALDEKRQAYQDAVWQKDGDGEWKKKDLSDKEAKEKADNAEKEWKNQIKENKRGEMIDNWRKPEQKGDETGESSQKESTLKSTLAELSLDKKEAGDTAKPESGDSETSNQLTPEQLKAVKDKIGGGAEGGAGLEHGRTTETTKVDEDNKPQVESTGTKTTANDIDVERAHEKNLAEMDGSKKKIDSKTLDYLNQQRHQNG